ncbi:M15 family metallopeptidase [Marinimicrobium sp. ARAG 43.8]|uniref:M15 family metallopeptidase n=1 Tax=Marinimicrobium sp. ARAG 43.8 TaxID=3418719 RepID=UPI003CEB6B8A
MIDGELFGLSQASMTDCVLGGRIRCEVLPFLTVLARAAQQAGFELAVASGFRDFERQKWIWDAKASGERPLLDERGQPLDARQLTDRERMWAILRWSALPGASRHHWGTEVDVFDRSSLPAGETLSLTVAETRPGGPFAAFHQWLDRYLASAENPGFYRPYDRDRGGVAPEPWHLSYAPVADRFQRELTVLRLREFLSGQSFALKPLVMQNLENIHERFVRVPEYGAH